MATGRENLVLAARIQGLNRLRRDRDRATWLLDRFGVADAADRLVRTWSGGMARKLDVAIGLVHRPEVLFLDEPTTGLDPEARAEMWAEIGRLAGDDRMTVLLTTHYLDEADRLAHRLAIIERGAVAVEGTPESSRPSCVATSCRSSSRPRTTPCGASTLLEPVPGLSSVLRDGCTVRARSESGARVVPAVFAALADAGIPVVSATVARPSLDDVYLRYAGRSFDGGGRHEHAPVATRVPVAALGQGAASVSRCSWSSR